MIYLCHFHPPNVTIFVGVKSRLHLSVQSCGSSIHVNSIMVLHLQLLSFIIIISMRSHNCQETSICKKVEECSQIMNLLKRRNNLPNITSVEVFEYVRSLQCDETTDMVFCPEVEGIHYTVQVIDLYSRFSFT